jgi:hypothetical protein
MLPLLALVAVYLRYRRTDSRLAPGMLWTALLWVAFLSMALIGLYQLYERLHEPLGRLWARIAELW